MPLYPNADALISDAMLRIDQFGAHAGVLVVEGPDDKRFFCAKAQHRQQVLAAGGRRLLLSAHISAVQRSIEAIAFLTDCDYEVALGTMSPSWNLIITRHADLEADLLGAEGFERLVGLLVPSALDDDDELARVSTAAQERAVALADILGRIRQVAKAVGFKVSTDIRHHKYRTQNSAELDVTKLLRAVFQSSEDCMLQYAEFEERVKAIPPSYDNCNGHDLVAALHHVLRQDFSVRDQSPEQLEVLLRTSVPEKTFLGLEVVDRLKQWERRVGRRILAF